MNYSNDENRQEVGALTITFFAGVVLSLCFALLILRHCEKITFTQTGKLNPNVATISELAELPSIGKEKAQAIIDYRNEQKTIGIRRRQGFHLRQGYGGQASGQEQKTFGCAGDLENVKGIGEKTIEKISQWLEFNND